MTDLCDAADFGPLVSREQAENEFRKAMNLFVGRRRRFSVEQLAKGSGVPTRLIECYRSYPLGHADYRPLHFGHKLSIAKFLGADFSTEWMGLADQGAFDIPDASEPPPGEIALECSEDTTNVIRMAGDGTFDNDCPIQLTRIAQRNINRGKQMLAVAERRKRA